VRILQTDMPYKLILLRCRSQDSAAELSDLLQALL